MNLSLMLARHSLASSDTIGRGVVRVEKKGLAKRRLGKDLLIAVKWFFEPSLLNHSHMGCARHAASGAITKEEPKQRMTVQEYSSSPERGIQVSLEKCDSG